MPLMPTHSVEQPQCRLWGHFQMSSQTNVQNHLLEEILSVQCAYFGLMGKLGPQETHAETVGNMQTPHRKNCPGIKPGTFLLTGDWHQDILKDPLRMYFFHVKCLHHTDNIVDNVQFPSFLVGELTQMKKLKFWLPGPTLSHFMGPKSLSDLGWLRNFYRHTDRGWSKLTCDKKIRKLLLNKIQMSKIKRRKKISKNFLLNCRLIRSMIISNKRAQSFRHSDTKIIPTEQLEAGIWPADFCGLTQITSFCGTRSQHSLQKWRKSKTACQVLLKSA